MNNNQFSIKSLELSRIAKNLPYSAIRKLIPYADAAKKHGIKVYHLNIGQPDIASPPEAIEVLHKYNQKLIEYSNSQGNSSFINKVVKYYKTLGIEIKPENVNVTNGGSEALQIAMTITCNPEDEIIIFEPFYANYNSFAIQNDVKLHPITTRIEENFALPKMSELEKHINERTKGILICNPGNPTGTLYSKNDLLELGKIIKKYNLFLFADEVYREFCYTDEPYFSCLQIPDIEQNVIIIDSVSKRFSLCGTRVGYLVSRNPQFMEAVLRFAQARLSSPTLGQIIAEAAFSSSSSDYFLKVKEEYKKRRDTLVEGLNKIPGVVCPIPKGAFYAGVKLPVDDAEKFAKWLLEEFQTDNQTVMVAPMGGFYATPKLGINEVRIAYVLNCDDIKNALNCLEKALNAYPGKTK